MIITTHREEEHVAVSLFCFYLLATEDFFLLLLPHANTHKAAPLSPRLHVCVSGAKIVLNNATNEKDFFNFSSLRLPSNAGKCSMLSEGKKSWFSPSSLTLHTTRSAKIPFFGDFCPRVATEKRGKEKTFSSNKSNLYKTKFLLAALKYWTGKPAALIRFVRKLAGD